MTNRTKFGKTRPVDKPYAVYKGYGPFGYTEMRVLKTYQGVVKEKGNPYARWMVAVKTDATGDRFDIGDSYIKDAIWGLMCVEAEPEWLREYEDGHLRDL